MTESLITYSTKAGSQPQFYNTSRFGKLPFRAWAYSINCSSRIRLAVVSCTSFHLVNLSVKYCVISKAIKVINIFQNFALIIANIIADAEAFNNICHHFFQQIKCCRNDHLAHILIFSLTWCLLIWKYRSKYCLQIHI